MSGGDSDGRTIFVAPAPRLTEGPTGCADQKPAPAWSNEPEPGPNWGDDLPADDTQLPSIGV